MDDPTDVDTRNVICPNCNMTMYLNTPLDRELYCAACETAAAKRQLTVWT